MTNHVLTAEDRALEALEILVVTYAMDDAQGALDLEAKIKPFLAASREQASPAPSGWKLVPIEPTREMWSAAGTAVVRLQTAGIGHHDKIVEAMWNAGLSASPTPPMALDATRSDT